MATMTPSESQQEPSGPTYIGISFGTLNSSIGLIGKVSISTKTSRMGSDRRLQMRTEIEIFHLMLSLLDMKLYVNFCSIASFLARKQRYNQDQIKEELLWNLEISWGKSMTASITYRVRFDDHEVQDQSKRLTMKIVDSGKGPVYQVESRADPDAEEPTIEHHSVVEVTALYLRKLKETAENFLSKSVDGVVVSVPPHFKDQQKVDLVTASQEAGFNVVHTVHEPVAAALAFAHSPASVSPSPKLDQKIVVLDLGGHQFNVTCLSSNKGLYSILSCMDDYKLGGVHFDEILVNHVKQEFQRKTKLDVSESRRAIHKLFNACERTKRSLTRQDVAPCSVESLYEGMDYHGSVNRNRFEMMADPLFARCAQVVHSALAEAGLTVENVDQVMLVGGASRMPRFQAKMQSLFGESTLFRTDVEPDEAISIGCAIQAGLISGQEDYASHAVNKDILHAQVLSKTVGVELSNGSMAPILLKKSPLPIRRSITVATSVQDQEDMYFAIYEGDDLAVAKNNILLAEVVLADLPTGKGQIKVELVFTMETDGILHVVAHEKSSGAQVKVKLLHK